MIVFTYDLSTRRSYCHHECLILLSFSLLWLLKIMMKHTFCVLGTMNQYWLSRVVGNKREDCKVFTFKMSRSFYSAGYTTFTTQSNMKEFLIFLFTQNVFRLALDGNDCTNTFFKHKHCIRETILKWSKSNTKFCSMRCVNHDNGCEIAWHSGSHAKCCW